MCGFKTLQLRWAQLNAARAAFGPKPLLFNFSVGPRLGRQTLYKIKNILFAKGAVWDLLFELRRGQPSGLGHRISNCAISPSPRPTRSSKVFKPHFLRKQKKTF